MAGSVNKAIIVGNCCADPDVRQMNNGKSVVNLSVATNESWKDKDGNKQERVEYHRVVIFSEGLCRIAENYLKKGSKVYLEGQLQTRSYEQDGVKKYSTEIVLQGFNSTLTMLDSKSEGQPAHNPIANSFGNPDAGSGQPQSGSLDDEIPFN